MHSKVKTKSAKSHAISEIEKMLFDKLMHVYKH